MDACTICGKVSEGITLEIEDDNGQTLEKHICNSCSQVISSIALKAVESELQPFVTKLERTIELITEINKVKSDGLAPIDQELYGDEELKEEDDEFVDDEKEITGLSNDALADQLLSFAKEIDLSDEIEDLLNQDVIELFWKSKGIPNTYAASAESKIKMKQAEKIAREKVVTGIFSASNEELARELADFAKKMEGKENGQGVYVQVVMHQFWRNKGLDYRSQSVETEVRKGQIERLAQEIVDKDFHEWRDKRLQMESEYLPQLTKVCLDWALSSGRNSVTIKDIKYFRQEKKLELLEATERALYLSVNNELKARKRTG